jgi:DNA-binding LacI/PurR family transcriptional regulator
VRKTAGRAGVDIVLVDAPEPTFEAAADSVRRLVKGPATAVIAFNDQMALGVIAGLARLGIAVPGDLSVIGFDDVPMAAMVAPPLTTISLPTEQAGTSAVELLGAGATTTTELFGTLVVRESTGTVTRRRANAAANGARRPSGGGRG